MVLDKNLFNRNRHKLLNKIENNSVVVLFSEAPKFRNGEHEYPFRQNSNIIYLTGILDPIHSLWLFKDSMGNTDVFILLPEYDEKTKIYQGNGISPKEIESISDIHQIFTYKETFYENLSHCNTIYCEKDKQSFLSNFINVEKIQDINPIIGELRLIKEPEEIIFVQKAINITGKAFHELLKNFKNFKKESDIEAFITAFFIKNGNLPHAYLPIVASGANALTLHYIKNNQKLQKKSLTLLDFGCEFRGYASDLSRTIPNNGKFNKRTSRIYNKVLSILNDVTRQMVVGTTIKELNNLANKLMEEALIELNLLKPSDFKGYPTISPCKKYFPHGISHFIGLDVHDSGSTDTVLKTNMILSCEPGIYIPEENIGIRIENNILISSKPINLMKNIAQNIDEIESLMNH